MYINTQRPYIPSVITFYILYVLKVIYHIRFPLPRFMYKYCHYYFDIERCFIACAWNRLQLFQLAVVRLSPSARVPVKAVFSISLIRSFCKANCPGEPALNQLETKFLHVLDDSSVPRAPKCTPLFLCSSLSFSVWYLTFLIDIYLLWPLK